MGPYLSHACMVELILISFPCEPDKVTADDSHMTDYICALTPLSCLVLQSQTFLYENGSLFTHYVAYVSGMFSAVL